jgi:hypothetical protein
LEKNVIILFFSSLWRKGFKMIFWFSARSRRRFRNQGDIQRKWPSTSVLFVEVTKGLSNVHHSWRSRIYLLVHYLLQFRKNIWDNICGISNF